MAVSKNAMRRFHSAKAVIVARPDAISADNAHWFCPRGVSKPEMFVSDCSMASSVNQMNQSINVLENILALRMVNSRTSRGKMIFLTAAPVPCLNTCDHQTHPCVLSSDILNSTNWNKAHMLSRKFRITGENVGRSYPHHIALIGISLNHGWV